MNDKRCESNGSISNDKCFCRRIRRSQTSVFLSFAHSSSSQSSVAALQIFDDFARMHAVPLRMLYSFIPNQKSDTMKISLFRNAIKTWKKSTVLKISKTILYNNNAKKLLTKKIVKK